MKTMRKFLAGVEDERAQEGMSESRRERMAGCGWEAESGELKADGDGAMGRTAVDCVIGKIRESRMKGMENMMAKTRIV